MTINLRASVNNRTDEIVLYDLFAYCSHLGISFSVKHSGEKSIWDITLRGADDDLNDIKLHLAEAQTRFAQV